MHKINFKLLLVSLLWLSSVLFLGFTFTAQAGEKININTASQAELETLNGIGPSKAAAIIEYREQNGSFESIEEIMQVPGIGPATFEKIKDDITVEDSEIGQPEQIVINELLPNPAGDDETEWIELKNIGEESVDLAGWKIKDLKNEYVFRAEDFESTVVPAGGFLLVYRQTSGLILNNSGGEEVQLFNSEGELISQTSYSQTAKEGVSWARDQQSSYSWTAEPTPGAENIIQAVSESDNNTESNMLFGPKVVYSPYHNIVLINELLPNPVGLDNGEWIEIYNNSDMSVNLQGWTLETDQGKFKLGYQIIKPKGYILLSRSLTSLRLRNIGGETLKLIDVLGWQVDEVSYSQAIEEGKSYNWCPQADGWLWLDDITPQQENKCPLENNPPTAYFEMERQQAGKDKIISLDASESYDTDGKIVAYEWEFKYPVEALGNKGKVFKFKNPTLWVKLLDNRSQVIKLTVYDNLGGQGTDEIELKGNQLKLKDKIYLSRLLPNPAGADKDNEWVEICSRSEQALNLDEVQLDDDEGGSQPYKLSGYKLPAAGCIKIFNSQSGLVLNNRSDKVRLLVDNQVIDEVKYGQAPDDYLYVRRGDDEWEWLPVDTQGNYQAENLMDEFPPFQENYSFLRSIAQLQNLAIGSWVKVSGQVTVEPGLLGANIFYIADASGGLQVYSYKKQFPALAVGDEVTVQGELVEYQGGVRLKVKQLSDIVNLGRAREIIKPLVVSVDEIDNNLLGSLVTVEGELVEIKNSSWWLDDKSGEIKIYLKRSAQIDKAGFGLGDKLRVTAIVDKYANELRLLPRQSADIKLLGKVKGVSWPDTEKTAINRLNEAKENSWIKYVIAILIAGLVILMIIVIRLKNKLT